MDPGWEPVSLDAFHVLCFCSAKSRNTPQRTARKLAVLGNDPASKPELGKYLSVCLFSLFSIVASCILFSNPPTRTCTLAFFVP